MYDYEQEYRRLRHAGQPGWGGTHPAKEPAVFARTLDDLQCKGVFPPAPADVLEIGCGNGQASLLMAMRGHHVVGVDISPTAIQWAREKFGEAGITGSFHAGNVCAMSFLADGGFDVVLDGACLHCLIGEDRAACLAEVRRVLRPDGAFVVSSMCGDAKSDDAVARFDHRRSCLLKDGKPYRTLKPVAFLVSELARAGFAVETYSISSNPWWDHVTMVCRKGEHAR